MNPFYVTFIIPSKGRATLANTVLSLYSQSSSAWNAVVCFDDVQPIIQSMTGKIEVINTPKKLCVGANGAGEVRNFAIEYAKSNHSIGSWIAFVDDDDTVGLNYVARTIKLSETIDADIIIYKMQYLDGTTLPPSGKQISELENKVGISFCVRTSTWISNNMRFDPSSGEDYQFLKKALQNCKIHIDDTVQYFVSPLGSTK